MRRADRPAGTGDAAHTGSGWVDIGRRLRHTWIAYWICLVLLLGAPLAAVGATVHRTATGLDDATPSTLVAGIAAVGLPLIAVSAFLVARAPRHLAVQGVQVSTRGLGLVRRSRWWAPATRAFVPWDDVHRIVRGLRQGTSARPVLEIHLLPGARLPQQAPHWAVPIPAGRQKWGPPSARPRVVLDVDGTLLTRLAQECALWRPDLCEGLLAVDDAPAARPGAAAPAEGSPTTSAAEPVTSGPAPDGAAPPQVNMRRQNAAGWIVATATSGYLAAGSAVFTLVWAFAGEYGGALITLAAALVLAPTTRALLRMAPRYTTRQGLSADHTGIILLQEPKRAFPGRRVHIPWSQVLHLRQDTENASHDSGHGPRYTVEVRTRAPLHGTELPHWASLDGPTLRITSNRSLHTELVRVLRAARPDLLPGG